MRRRKLWTVTDHTGESYRAEHVISSMPIRELIAAIEPKLPGVRAGPRRNRCAIAIFSPSDSSSKSAIDFPTTGSTSTIRPSKSAESRTTSRGRPRWCPIRRIAVMGWSTSALRAMACGRRRMRTFWRWPSARSKQVGLGTAADVTDGCVIRQPKAYPVYDDAYQQHVETVRAAIEARTARGFIWWVATACTSTTTRIMP